MCLPRPGFFLPSWELDFASAKSARWLTLLGPVMQPMFMAEAAGAEVATNESDLAGLSLRHFSAIYPARP